MISMVTYKTAWRMAHILKTIKNRAEIRFLIKLRELIDKKLSSGRGKEANLWLAD